MYILVFSFQFMADKDSQRNADGEEHDETAEQLQQPYAVHEMHVCGTDADEGCRKEDESSIMHQKAVEEIITRLPAERRPISLEHLAFHPVRHLPADRIAFPLKGLSGLLADRDPAGLLQGRDSPVHYGQGLGEPRFEPFHPVARGRGRPCNSPPTLQSCVLSPASSRHPEVPPSISEKSNFLFIGPLHFAFLEKPSEFGQYGQIRLAFPEASSRRFGIDFLRVIFSFLHSEVCFRRLCHIS